MAVITDESVFPVSSEYAVLASNAPGLPKEQPITYEHCPDTKT